MYIALMVKNYDTEPVAVMFTTNKLAHDYIEKWWKEELKTAMDKCNEFLVINDCYYEKDHAQIVWLDKARIDFYVVKDSRPQEWR